MEPKRIATIFRQESGLVVASLVRRFGDIDLAEEVVQEAFVEAMTRWPTAGLPPNPGAWITTTARNRAIDRLRREATRLERHERAAELYAPEPAEEDEAVRDDRLRLIFTCCHPALAPNARVALTLRLIGGLQVPEIARAFLMSEATLAQRLVRAKRKIKANAIPYRVPDADELPQRLQAVLAVLYLIFNEGHHATAGDRLDRVDLADEALRLARLVVQLVPDDLEARGLLALMLLVRSRRDARVSEDGAVVLLADQDRDRWDGAMIAEGHAIVRGLLAAGRPGPYQIQAAINAVHTDPAAEPTAWAQILDLYDLLYRVAPGPVVALNRAIALAEVAGPAPALAELDAIEGLDAYAPFFVARADLLRRLRRTAEAVDAYAEAIAMTKNEAERRFLVARRAALLS